MTDRELMQQALEALGWTDEWRPDGLKEQAITALRERLAQSEREWVGLTDEEIEDIHCTPPKARPRGKFPFARMIEAKLKEKNNGN